MKILDVSPRAASPMACGSSVRVFHLLRHLARNHEVRQFSLERRGGFSIRAAEEERQVAPSYRERIRRGGAGGLLLEISERAWVSAPIFSGAALAWSRPAVLDSWLAWADVVLVEFPWQFSYCRRRRPQGGLVLSSLNVEPAKFASYAETFRRPFARNSWLSYIAKAETRAVAHSDLVLAVSSADRAETIARYRTAPEKVVEIPNGADTDSYFPWSPREKAQAKRALGLPDRPTVLFAGADVPPNREGLKWVERIAARTHTFTFLVVGRVSPPGRRGSIVATGLVDRFEPYLKAADFSLCPIAHGGGTKIKLLESLAAGLPTVAFSESLQGLAFRDGQHLLVSEKNDDALLAALARLAGDGDLARRLAENGSLLVSQHYSWKDSARKLEESLLKIGERRAQR